MASIGELVAKLGSTKAELDQAKSSVAVARRTTEEMATQAGEMGLDDTSRALRALNVRMEATDSQLHALRAEVDELIASAEALRTTSGSGTPPPTTSGWVLPGSEPDISTNESTTPGAERF